MTVMRLETVSFRYPDAEAFALSGVDLEVLPGEVVWLFGALGAGTSTLLLVAAGLAPRLTGGTCTGRVTTLDRSPEERSDLSGRVAYLGPTPILQLSGVAGTVVEEVAFTPASLGWPRPRILDAAGAAMDRLGIGHLAARRPSTLSGGESQRTLLAALLAAGPALWLLDEPTSALDPAGRALALALLGEEARQGATVVIASDDTDGLLPVATRLVVLDQGRVAADGRPGELLSSGAIRRMTGGSTSIAELAWAAADIAPSPRLTPPFPLTLSEAMDRWK